MGLGTQAAFGPGTRVKQIRLEQHLGGSSHAVVYRGVDQYEGTVAVKILDGTIADKKGFASRFRTRGRAVASLDHPQIIRLLDYWWQPGAAFLVSPYLPGGSLDDLIARGPLLPDQVLPILATLEAALSAAHDRNVAHGNITPDNILLDANGTPCLGDFAVGFDPAADAVPSDLDYVYRAPEQLRGEAATFQSDQYSLAVVLYALLRGKPPTLSNRNNGSHPVIQIDGLSPDLIAVLQHATAEQPSDRYSDIHSFATAVRHTLVNVTLDAQAAATQEVRNPYKGLQAFDEADALAGDFFGRDRLTAEIIARMQEQEHDARFVVVDGPSGSGKSSAVRASTLPTLQRGALPGSEQWLYAEVITPGAQPLTQLEQALRSVAVDPPANLGEQLRESERGLTNVITWILPPDPSVKLLLVIDQFEEIFALTEDEAIRRFFLRCLIEATKLPDSRLRIVATIRADFLERAMLYAELTPVLRRPVNVLPLEPDELRDAIVKPARNVGLTFEPGLDEQIMNDVSERPGELPLLQYVLRQLAERREGMTLTKAVYRAMGGVAGALSASADELYDKLDRTAQEAVRQVFLRLVTLGEGVGDTRRRVRRAELASVVKDEALLQQALGTFGDARLLTFDHEPGSREPTVEVAHEALIRSWEKLKHWLDASREDLRLQRRLHDEAAAWRGNHKQRKFLAPAGPLEQYEALRARQTVALDDDEREYLDASLNKQRADRRRRRGLVAGIIAGLSIALLVISFFALAAALQARVAGAQRLRAESDLRADRQPLLALRLALEAEARLPEGSLNNWVLMAGSLLPQSWLESWGLKAGDLNSARQQVRGTVAQRATSGRMALLANDIGQAVSSENNSQTALISKDRQRVDLYHYENDRPVTSTLALPAGADVRDVTFSPDPQARYLGVRYSTPTSDTWQGALFRSQDAQPITTTLALPAGAAVQAVTFSPDPQARYLEVRYTMPGTDARQGALFTSMTGQKILLNSRDAAQEIAFYGGPDRLYVGVFYSGSRAELWDASKDQPQLLTNLGSGVENGSIFYDKAHNQFIVSYVDGRVYVIDATLLVEARTLLAAQPSSLDGLAEAACQRLLARFWTPADKQGLRDVVGDRPLSCSDMVAPATPVPPQPTQPVGMLPAPPGASARPQRRRQLWHG